MISRGKESTFYPDIYIPSENKIIEVKSTFTYDKFEEKNEEKLTSTAAQGYNIEYWIFNKKGKLLKLMVGFPNLIMVFNHK